MSKATLLFPRMPAEWEPHRATWISWPHEAADFPGKLPAISWVYAEIVKILARSELVEILCHDLETKSHALEVLSKSGITENFRLHLLPTDRSWLRDSAPTATLDAGGELTWTSFKFNGWAKYDNFHLDATVPDFISKVTEIPLVTPTRSQTSERIVLEGGAFDVDGQGTLITTEECLLSKVQERNPGLDRTDYEEIFRDFLGISKTIWLESSCEGDDTHGHVDDVARFVAPGKLVFAYEPDSTSPNHRRSIENLRRLKNLKDARGRKIEVTTLPMPSPIIFDGYPLPASYANFYIGNTVVIVPTFNDENDRRALNTLASLFPTRKVIGIYSGDLVLGLGTLHCLTQQEPRKI